MNPDEQRAGNLDEDIDEVIGYLHQHIAEMKEKFGPDRWLRIRNPEGGYLAAPILAALATALNAKAIRQQ